MGGLSDMEKHLITAVEYQQKHAHDYALFSAVVARVLASDHFKIDDPEHVADLTATLANAAPQLIKEVVAKAAADAGDPYTPVYEALTLLKGRDPHAFTGDVDPAELYKLRCEVAGVRPAMSEGARRQCNHWWEVRRCDVRARRLENYRLQHEKFAKAKAKGSKAA